MVYNQTGGRMKNMREHSTMGDAERPAPDQDNSNTTEDTGTTKELEASAAPDRAAVAAPETVVNSGRTPEPDYPRYRVQQGEHVRLLQIDPNESEHYSSKEDAKEELKKQRDRISDLQEQLYAENRQSLLIVLQALDTGGKDGTIRSVFAGVNPQGCQVWSFKVPSAEELSHDFLWRYHAKAPPRGMITIFNRSHYEDVLVVRVKKLVADDVWQSRYALINDFERMLTLNGTTILKFYLHISKDEQKRRLEKRLEDPRKQWKFSINDIKERKHWEEYQSAIEDAINRCSNEYAPWYVIPANKKWYRNLVIARAIADTLEALNPRFPETALEKKRVSIPD